MKIARVIVIFSLLFASLTAPAQGANYDANAFLKTRSQNLSYEKAFALYQEKCTYPQNPPFPCFLTEKEVNPGKGRPDRVILFRGEPGLKSLPMTSGFFRWALDSGEVCKGTCTNAELNTYLMDAAKKLRPLSEKTSFFFRTQDKSWRDNSGRPIPGTLRAGETGLDVVARAHKLETGLYFEYQKNKMFDPMVSFSFDPTVADLFAQLYGNGQGVLWIASVPKTKIRFLQGSECKTLTPEPGTLYDFNGCVGTALNELEIEVNAVMYLPTEYFYGRLLNR